MDLWEEPNNADPSAWEEFDDIDIFGQRATKEQKNKFDQKLKTTPISPISYENSQLWTNLLSNNFNNNTYTTVQRDVLAFCSAPRLPAGVGRTIKQTLFDPECTVETLVQTLKEVLQALFLNKPPNLPRVLSFLNIWPDHAQQAHFCLFMDHLSTLDHLTKLHILQNAECLQLVKKGVKELNLSSFDIQLVLSFVQKCNASNLFSNQEFTDLLVFYFSIEQGVDRLKQFFILFPFFNTIQSLECWQFAFHSILASLFENTSCKMSALHFVIMQLKKMDFADFTILETISSPTFLEQSCQLSKLDQLFLVECILLMHPTNHPFFVTLMNQTKNFHLFVLLHAKKFSPPVIPDWVFDFIQTIPIPSLSSSSKLLHSFLSKFKKFIRFKMQNATEPKFCNICYQTGQPEDSFLKFPCSHTFCFECYTVQLTTKCLCCLQVFN